MKKFLALLLSLSMVLALSACGGTKSDDTTKADETKTDAPAETATDFKVGFIMLHDENSTYDLNFINAAKEACEKLGVEYKIITNVPEVRSATTRLLSWPMTAATSSSPTPSVTRTT